MLAQARLAIGTVLTMAPAALVFTAAPAHDRTFAPLRAAAAAEVSANWSGDVVTGDSTTYTSVTATWREPTVTCNPSDAGAGSAFWVGLGGYSQSSQALEQVGTSSDCDASTGLPSYYAWYELVPAGSVTIKTLKIRAGDLVTTSVNVLDGTTIELQVIDRTRGTRFTTEKPFATPDLSSAEWIAEAPSDCSQYRCRQIPLANFGSIQFTRIAALGNGAGGTLTANPGWTTTPITLVPTGNRGFFPGPDRFSGVAASSAGASPGAASTDGRAFTVSWRASDT
jgi:hypothetical protein